MWAPREKAASRPHESTRRGPVSVPLYQTVRPSPAQAQQLSRTGACGTTECAVASRVHIVVASEKSDRWDRTGALRCGPLVGQRRQVTPSGVLVVLMRLHERAVALGGPVRRRGTNDGRSDNVPAIGQDDGSDIHLNRLSYGR